MKSISHNKRIDGLKMENLSTKSIVSKLQKNLDRGSRTRILAGASPERPNICKEINESQNNNCGAQRNMRQQPTEDKEPKLNINRPCGANMNRSNDENGDKLNPCQAKTNKSNDDCRPSMKNPSRTTRQCMEPVEKPDEDCQQRSQRQCIEPIDGTVNDCQQQRNRRPCVEPVEKVTDDCQQRNQRACTEQAEKYTVGRQQRNQRPCAEPTDRTTDEFQQKNWSPTMGKPGNECPQRPRQQYMDPVERIIEEGQLRNRRPRRSDDNTIERKTYCRNQQPGQNPCEYVPDYFDDEADMRNWQRAQDAQKQQQQQRPQQRQQQRPQQQKLQQQRPQQQRPQQQRSQQQRPQLQQQQPQLQHSQQQRFIPCQNDEFESVYPPPSNVAAQPREECRTSPRQQEPTIVRQQPEERPVASCRNPLSGCETQRSEVQRLNLLRQIELHQRALVLKTQELLKNEQEQLRQRINNEKLKMSESQSRKDGCMDIPCSSSQQDPEADQEQCQTPQLYSQSRQTQWESPLATSTPLQTSCNQPQRKKLIYRPPTPLTDCSISGEDSIDDQLQEPTGAAGGPKTRIPYVPTSQTDSCTSDEFEDNRTASDISASGCNRPANDPLQPTYSCNCTPSYPKIMPSDVKAPNAAVPCPQSNAKYPKNEERRRLCEFTTEYYYITPQNTSIGQQDPNASMQRSSRSNNDCYGNARPVQSSPFMSPENCNQQCTPQR